MAVVTRCVDSKGKKCTPVLVDKWGRTKKNPDCKCTHTVIDPIGEAKRAAWNAVLLVGALVFLATRRRR